MSLSIVTFVLAALLASETVLLAGAFNLDVINYVRHDGTPEQPDSMYGFSVALHKEKQNSWVIIGAPRADISHVQQGVHRGGAVYRCHMNEDNRCWLIQFDSKGSWENENGDKIDTKSNQWFGATVASSGVDGPLVACAPRYVYHTANPRKVERIEPVGTCFVARNNFKEFTEYSPCRTSAWGYHRQGSCQAGFSAAITADRLFVGAPGSWYWQGQEYSINADAVYPYRPPKNGQFGDGGQEYSHSVQGNPADKVYATGEGTLAEDDSYLGYSTATGDLNGDGTKGVAVGMPRGGHLLGKVLLYSWNMTNLQNITGEQIGAYFGYSLCVVDVDGDRLDDLVIGAPMYTHPNNEGKYEMGRVYIMFQGKYNKFLETITREGTQSRGRFGLALTSLGDINLDGFGDFAVGAPYDGPHGRGAVYVYHGSADGPLEKPSQIIYAEDVGAGPQAPRTFGFSVAGGIDLDGNQYTDLVVGAYESNRAITFKARPVAVMEASTVFEADSKLISLDDKKCQVGDQKVTCTVVHSCLRYTGINVPAQTDIDVSWVLDSKKFRAPRMFFLAEKGRNIRNTTMRLSRGKTECRTEQVYITENIRDKLTPMEVEMKYHIRGSQQTLSRQPRAILEPILDQNRGTVQRDAINIQKNCGPDNVCIPDLRLNITTVDKYLLGSKELLTIDVTIPNRGEDAFEAAFYMSVPPGVSFRKVEHSGKNQDSVISCSPPSAATNNTLKCDIGNPLPSGKSAHFKLIFMPTVSPGQSPSYDFRMEVNSTNAESEATAYDNNVHKKVHIWVETQLNVKGASVDSELHYNISEYTNVMEAKRENDLGPHIVNLFEITNNGPSAIEEAEVFILIPHETIAGDKLMYLLNQPETSGNVKCEPTGMVNSLHLQLDNELVRTSFLESQGAVEKGSMYYSSSSLASATTSAAAGSSSTMQYSSSDHAFEDSYADASNIHKQRNNEAAAQAAAAVTSQQLGGSQFSTSSSFHSVNHGPTVTYSTNVNRNTSRGSDSQYYVKDSSTDNVGGGGSADAHRQGVSYQRSGSSQYNAGKSGQRQRTGGMVRLDDIQTEGNVHGGGFGTSSFVSSYSASAPGSSSTGSPGESASSTGRRRMFSQQDDDRGATRGYMATSNMNQVAQGKSAFHTGSVDLLGRNNVDDELRMHKGHSGHFAANNGAQQQLQQNNRQSSASSSNTNTWQSVHTSGTQGAHKESSNSGYHAESVNHPDIDLQGFDEDFDPFEFDDSLHNVEVEPQSYHSALSQQQQQFKHYPRGRRELPELELNQALTCNRTKCIVLRCVAGRLENNANAFIAIRARLVAQTMQLIAPSVPLNVSTMVVARVTKLPYIGSPQDKPIKSYEVVTTAIPIPDPKPDVVPLWVVVLSACAGVLILLLLIYLLYKCGFFNRNRPTDSQERQPLNRNNGYHGDEHL